MLQRLTHEAPGTVREVRGRGLWAGVEVHEQFAPVRPHAAGVPTFPSHVQ